MLVAYKGAPALIAVDGDRRIARGQRQPYMRAEICERSAAGRGVNVLTADRQSRALAPSGRRQITFKAPRRRDANRLAVRHG